MFGRSAIILWFLAMGLSGCTTTPDILDFGTGPGVDAEGRREIRPMTWPAAGSGEPPRYAFAGALYGEDNFHRARNAEVGLGQRLLDAWRWLVGLYDENYRPVTLHRPQSGLVDQATRRILVTDISRQAVYVFDQEQGQLEVWEHATPAIRFAGPTGIALGVSGDVYVADSELGYVTRLDTQGVSRGVIGKGVLRRPVGLAFDAGTGQLFVADAHAHDIKVFSAEGQHLRTLGKRGGDPGEYNFPTYITLAQGELYVSDTMNARVQVMEPESGRSLRVIGERGLNVGNMVRPKGIAVDPDGNIYVIESYYDYMLVYNREGALLLALGGTGKETGKFYLPAGIWRDNANRLFVADMFNARVQLFRFLGSEPANDRPLAVPVSH